MQVNNKIFLFEEFLSKVERLTGVRYGKDKEYFILSRLADRLDGEGADDPWDLIRKVCNSDDRKWCEDLFCDLLIHETYFFREKDVFEYLTKKIFALYDNTKYIKPVLNIWSASCSNGQEAITMSILLEEGKFFHNNFQFKIHASDLNKACINKAKSGLYSDLEVRRGLSDQQKIRYFQKHQSQWLLNDVIQKNITYEQLNLMDPFGFREKFDVVFLRNTLIYFSDEIRRKILSKIIAQINPGGYIVLGSVENIPRMDMASNLKNVYKSIYQIL